MPALLVLTACNNHQPTTAQREHISLLLQVEDSLKAGNMAFATQQISQGLAQSPDSDIYYLWMSMLGKRYYTAMNADSFLHCNRLVGDYIRRLPDTLSQVRRHLYAGWLVERGVYHATMTGRLDSAITYNQQALQQLNGLQGETPYRIMALTNLADNYRQTGQLDLSTDHYMQALEIADSARLNAETYIIISLGISSVYTAMGDFEASHDWWSRTEELLPKMKTTDLFLYYNNRGNDFFLQQDYVHARQCFETLDSMLTGKPEYEWDRIFARTNLADVYIKLGMTDEARPLTAEAEQFFRKVGFDVPLYYIDTQKMELALLDGRTAEAHQQARQTLAELADSARAAQIMPEQQRLRLQVALQAMEQSADWQGALQAQKRLDETEHAIHANNRRMQMRSRLMQYQHDKQLLQQQQEIDHSRMTTRWAWTLFAVAVLIIALMLIMWRNKYREQRLNQLTTRQQITRLRMQNTRNRITPHFIFNALSHEMLAQMNGKEADLSTLVQLLRRGIAQADELETTLGEELEFVDYYVSIEGQQMGRDFVYQKNVAPDVDLGYVKLPSMMVQIFAENAIKHGLRSLKPAEGRQRMLVINASRQAEGTLVEVIDNGQGIRSDQLHEQTGMKVVRQTIQLLNESNREHIDFGVGNRTDGTAGCRSWLWLPDDYHYTLTS